jgi:hypothetical protein
MAVQPHIDGDLLDTTDEAAVREAGARLASLHRALAVHRNGPLTEVEPGRTVDLHRRIDTWLAFEDRGWRRLRRHGCATRWLPCRRSTPSRSRSAP